MDADQNAGNPISSRDVDVVEPVGPERMPQLLRLFAQAWWTAGRSATGVTAMLAGSDVALGLVHRPTDRLVGFTRALSDRVYRATVYDVIVEAEARGTGLGRMLLDAISAHPLIAGVERVELVCPPALVPFYRRWGFTDDAGGSLIMRRSRPPEL